MYTHLAAEKPQKSTTHDRIEGVSSAIQESNRDPAITQDKYTTWT